MESTKKSGSKKLKCLLLVPQILNLLLLLSFRHLESFLHPQDLTSILNEDKQGVKGLTSVE
jgi:hypothetical protein